MHCIHERWADVIVCMMYKCIHMNICICQCIHTYIVNRCLSYPSESHGLQCSMSKYVVDNNLLICEYLGNEKNHGIIFKLCFNIVIFFLCG